MPCQWTKKSTSSQETRSQATSLHNINIHIILYLGGRNGFQNDNTPCHFHRLCQGEECKGRLMHVKRLLSRDWYQETGVRETGVRETGVIRLVSGGPVSEGLVCRVKRNWCKEHNWSEGNSCEGIWRQRDWCHELGNSSVKGTRVSDYGVREQVAGRLVSGTVVLW